MKKIHSARLVALLVIASFSNLSNSQVLTGQITDSEELQEAALSFSEGGATNGNEYFNGLVAAIVAVDVKFGEIDRLDEMDGSEKQFYDCINLTLKKIEEGRAAIELYKDKKWPKRAEFHVLTIEWLATVENIVKTNLTPLVAAMAKPADEMTDEESTQYETYLIALEAYYEVDGRWVDFQYEYADANDFTIEGTIDEEAIMEEEGFTGLEGITNGRSINDIALSFSEGNAANGNEYFNGLVAAIVAVDVKFGEIDRLDEMDGSEKQFYDCINLTLKKIEEGRAAIELYKDKKWPKRAEFHLLTLEWFATVENIVKTNLTPLVAEMAKPADEMTDLESTQYDTYLIALAAYYEVDGRWVAFQYEYAAANDFVISGTIDEEAIMEEEGFIDVEGNTNERRITNEKSINAAALSFSEGNAANGNEYFNGLVAIIVEIDVKFGEVERLDEMNASENKINACINILLKKIEEGRAAIELYKDKKWPKRAEFHVLTMAWFATIEKIVKTNLTPMVAAMAKPAEEMTDVESKKYDKYLIALEKYYDVDGRWVAFQYEYAAANGFVIVGIIDQDTIIDEELDK